MKTLAGIFLVFVTLTAFAPIKDSPNVLEGVWIRRSDHLRIKVSEVNTTQLESFIIAEGDEKFPCDVHSTLIDLKKQVSNFIFYFPIVRALHVCSGVKFIQ